MLRDGKWVADWQPVQAKDDKGGFVRQTVGFRNWVTRDGSAGATGEGGFKAERGRYHGFRPLVACPILDHPSVTSTLLQVRRFR